MTRTAINLNEEIRKAVEWLFVPGNAFGGNDYITATEVEQRVRAALEEKAAGAEYGSHGYSGGWHSNIRLSGLNGCSLLSRCRDHLLAEVASGRLSCHNFGRGHISGMRFRLPGSGITETEQRTLEVKAKRESRGIIRHLRHPEAKPYSCRRLCETDRQRKSYGRRPSRVWVTDEADKVTCKHCLALMAKQIAG